jgi:hypothetical protein
MDPFGLMTRGSAAISGDETVTLYADGTAVEIPIF